MKIILYLVYLYEWKCFHSGKAFKGCSPVCYNEWLDCEFAEMVNHPEDYSGHWYSGILRYYHGKR